MFSKKSSGGKAPYPQQPAYPTQQAAAAPPAQPPPYGYPPSAPPGAPPPYTPGPQQQQQQQVYYPPGAQPYAPGYSYPYGQPAAAAYGPAPPVAQPCQPTTYVVQGGFDAGARFDGVARPNIPPPPPGCAPNMAQLAAFQGHNVVVTQRPSNLWDGGSDGGYTLF